MRKLLFFIPVLTIIIVSCQKEIDWGLGDAADKMLVKTISRTGTDSTIIEYSYDANRKLTREKTTGSAGGQDLTSELVIKRNSSGVITSTVQKAAALIAVGIDSIVIRYNYSTANSRYTSSVFSLTLQGLTVADSAVYAYDGSGKITGDSHYLQITGLPIPIPPVLALKNTYTYSTSGTNITVLAQDAASTPGGPLSPVSTQTYTMDTKRNPLIIGNEAIVLTRTGLFNANNPTKVVLVNTVTPANDFTMDYTYKYNSANKPDSSYGTRTPGGAVTTIKYFYQ